MDRVMNNAVPVRCGADHAFLRLKNQKVVVTARLISFGLQLVVKLPEFLFQKEIKLGRRIFETFVALGQTGGL